MARIDEDGNPRPADGFDWGRFAGYLFNGVVMYAFGYWIGQGGLRSTESASVGTTPLNFTCLDATCPDHVVTLATAIVDGQALSKRLGCTIRLKYRDKVVLIYRGRSHQQLMEDYIEAPKAAAK